MRRDDERAPTDRLRALEETRPPEGEKVVPRSLQTEVLTLQAAAGNAAVAGLLRTRVSSPLDLGASAPRSGDGRARIQRQPKEQPGWSDADPNVDPATGFSWNKDKHDVGTVGRYPLQNLAEGNQGKWLGSESRKLTKESAGGRAIGLVPSKLVPTDPVTVLLHLHGYIEDASTRPYGGWRQHRGTHKVRDVEHDRIAQQIEAAADPQIIGLLPQGGEESQFSKDQNDPYNTFSSDTYIDAVLDKLVDVGALKSKPTKRKVVLAAHSGGGHTVRSMMQAENLKRAGKSAAGHSSAPGALAEVVLFDAINNGKELTTTQEWVTGKLDDLHAVLSNASTPTPDKDKALAAAVRFRGYYSEGGTYDWRYKEVAKTIKAWFESKGAALGPYADRVWALYQIVPVQGVGHETLIRGSALGNKKAPVAGTLTDALNTLKNPTAAKPRPVAPPPPPPKAPKKSRKAATSGAGASRGLRTAAATSSHAEEPEDEDDEALRRALYSA